MSEKIDTTLKNSPADTRRSNKPVVNYVSLLHCKVGQSAVVLPVDHQSPLVSNTKYVRTSVVLAYDTVTGEFETCNTRYQPRAAAH
ncbi:hypothetical protein F6X40_09800 [Paraburkholderia sp. UCT31]|uniref:hypothetical protein n=1 Tax=Paraburkholderia sp. UCT31 TaxID=2615209 RepID=UPI001655F1B2|nr:hypothetical protein [Paraburkholderia sp. UCT31]MBC8737101.1 hypothetical protein [Paraburkholderia sp. UCT31]